MRMQQVEGGRGRLSRRRLPGPDKVGQGKGSSTPQAREVELKFQVPELAAESLSRDLDGRVAQVSELVARYFDTEDGRLAKVGFSLRLRREDDRWFQTLKISEKGGIYDRQEDEVEVLGLAGDDGPGLDPSRHDGTPAGEALRKLMKSGRFPELAERSISRVVRRTLELKEGDTRMELAFDLGSFAAGKKEIPVCELEFELKAGEPRDLCAQASRWIGPYGLRLASESKSVRGERMAAGQPMPLVKASTPRLEEGMDGDAALRAVVRSCLDQILPNADAVASGSLDHDHIHQLRVGLRRLRTAFREMGDLSGDIDPAWEAPLAEAFRQLGTFRDREAVLEALRPKLIAAGAGNTAWMKSAEGVADPVATVRDPGFQAVLVSLLGFALGASEAGKGESLEPLLRRRLKALHQKVVDDGGHFKSLSEASQHRVRKRLKRLRYLSEFVAPLYGRNPVDAYLDALRPAQDALGTHNDLAVAGEMAKRAADSGDPDAGFALRWLERQQKESVKASRKALERIAEAPRFWKGGQSRHH